MFKKIKLIFAAFLLNCSPAVVEAPEDLAASSVIVRSDGNKCGGTWVSENVIITSAHCVDSGKTIEVYSKQSFGRAYIGQVSDIRDLAWIETQLVPGRVPHISRPENYQILNAVVHVPDPWVAWKVQVGRVSLAWDEAYLTVSAFDGWSGSGVFNKDGDLVCVITARTNDNQTVCKMIPVAGEEESPFYY